MQSEDRAEPSDDESGKHDTVSCYRHPITEERVSRHRLGKKPQSIPGHSPVFERRQYIPGCRKRIGKLVVRGHAGDFGCSNHLLLSSREADDYLGCEPSDIMPGGNGLTSNTNRVERLAMALQARNLMR